MPNPFDMLLEPEESRDESTWRWATVTSVSPLRIRLDQDEDELDGDPIDLVGGLEVGDRVWVQLHRSRGRRGAQPLIMAAKPKPKPAEAERYVDFITPLNGLSVTFAYGFRLENMIVINMRLGLGTGSLPGGGHQQEIATIDEPRMRPSGGYSPWAGTLTGGNAVVGLVQVDGRVQSRWTSQAVSSGNLSVALAWTS